MRARTILLLAVWLGAIGVAPALAANPFLVDEDFEDGVADGFIADSTCFFGDAAQLGSVVDDGTGNAVYSLSEQIPNEVYVSSTVVSDFDLRFDVVFKVGPEPGDVGLPGLVFRANPDGQTGYILDFKTLYVATPDAGGGCMMTEIGRDTVPTTSGSHTMRVLVKDDKIKIFRDGILVIHVTDATYADGLVGLAEVNGAQILIDNLTLKIKTGS
jgi:hypothetical protein